MILVGDYRGRITLVRLEGERLVHSSTLEGHQGRHLLPGVLYLALQVPRNITRMATEGVS